MKQMLFHLTISKRGFSASISVIFVRGAMYVCHLWVSSVLWHKCDIKYPAQ